MNSPFSFSASSVDTFMIWGISLFLLIIALLLQWPVIKHRLAERKLLCLINKYGRETMHDVMLPDGLGDSTYIEHLVLTTEAIVVLYVKRYRGVIFSGEQIDEWTQVLNNHSYRFPNPLRQLEMDIMAINSLIDSKDVRGLVLFTQGSEFPKGKPANVMTFAELQDGIKAFKAGDVPPALHTAWKRLRDQAQNCSKDFIRRMREDDSQQGHAWLATILVLAAIGWLGWHLL